jgi:DNA-binding transcriptional LysR family regulator
MSVGLAKLESLVGQVLFNRTNRRIELTPAGATFAVHARRIETELAMALQAMAQEQPRKLIRVGLISTLPSAWVGNATMAAHKAEGERLEIVEGRMLDLLPRLERGRIDLLIGILGNDTRERETLFEEGYALALPIDHPHAHRRSVRPEDVADADMIVRRNCEALPDVSRFFTQRGIRPFFAARTHNDDRAVAYVKAGLGITVMPACFAQPGMAMPRLEGFDQRRRVGLLIEPDSYRRVEHSATVARFTDALRSAAAAQPRGW